MYKGIDPTVNLIYKENAGALVKKGENKNVEEIINIQDNISAPITKDQKLGEVKYTLNGETIGSVDLVAQNTVEKIGIGSMTKKIFSSWFRLLR